MRAKPTRSARTVATTTRRVVTTIAASVLLVTSAGMSPAAADPPSKETTTTLGTSASSITLGQSVTLSGSVTWMDDSDVKGVKDGTVTVKGSDGTCESAAFDDEIGSESFTNADAEIDAPFSADDTPTSTGTYAYKAIYGGGNHSRGVAYSSSESDCVEVVVTVAAEGRDAPAWAAEYLRTNDSVAEACNTTWGSNYTGEVQRQIGKAYEGQSFATWDDADDGGVFDDVDSICAGNDITT